jgi:hypothetical protein
VAVPPWPVSPGAARGSLAVDKQAPRASDFPISENRKITFPHKKNRYKVSKNLRKIMEVGNEIWNTFHN